MACKNFNGIKKGDPGGLIESEKTLTTRGNVGWKKIPKYTITQRCRAMPLLERMPVYIKVQ